MTRVRNKLILLDRDGVINRDSADYIKSVAEFVPIEGSLEAMVRLSRSGLLLGLCSNQSAIGRGLIDEPGLQAIFAKLNDALAEHGTALDAIEYCPHLPDAGCLCRKPQPGMLLSVMARLQSTPAQTTFVGDSLSDLQAALAAGCHPVLVRTGNGRGSEAAARDLGVIEVHDSLAAFTDAEIARRQMGAQQ